MCTLYERITSLCKEKGVSGSRMCLDLGLSKSTLSDMNHGRTKGISTATAQKIAAYFGVSVGYLLGEEPEQKQNPPTEQNLSEGEMMLVELFRKLPEESQKMYLEVLRATLKSQLKD